MEQLPALTGTIKEWDREKGVYKTTKTLDLSRAVDFGNITISMAEKPPILDPTDFSPTITLNKKAGVTPAELHVFELRSPFETPKSHVVGKTIMQENPFFYFSKLKDFRRNFASSSLVRFHM